MKVTARKRCKLFQVEQGGGIPLFKHEIFQGSFYICDVCNRGLYKRSVIHLSLDIRFHMKYLQVYYPMIEEHTFALHATKSY